MPLTGNQWSSQSASTKDRGNGQMNNKIQLEYQPDTISLLF